MEPFVLHGSRMHHSCCPFTPGSHSIHTAALHSKPYQLIMSLLSREQEHRLRSTTVHLQSIPKATLIQSYQQLSSNKNVSFLLPPSGAFFLKSHLWLTLSIIQCLLNTCYAASSPAVVKVSYEVKDAMSLMPGQPSSKHSVCSDQEQGWRLLDMGSQCVGTFAFPPLFVMWSTFFSLQGQIWLALSNCLQTGLRYICSHACMLDQLGSHWEFGFITCLCIPSLCAHHKCSTNCWVSLDADGEWVPSTESRDCSHASV